MTIGHTYRFSPRDDHFGFGWETGRIARAIALGHGFSNPFHGITGPTAWIAPLYPYFLAGVFKIFGVYSNASAWVALPSIAFFLRLTCATIYYIGREVFGPKIARPDVVGLGLGVVALADVLGHPLSLGNKSFRLLVECGRPADAHATSAMQPWGTGSPSEHCGESSRSAARRCCRCCPSSGFGGCSASLIARARYPACCRGCAAFHRDQYSLDAAQL